MRLLLIFLSLFSKSCLSEIIGMISSIKVRFTAFSFVEEQSTIFLSGSSFYLVPRFYQLVDRKVQKLISHQCFRCSNFLKIYRMVLFINVSVHNLPITLFSILRLTWKTWRTEISKNEVNDDFSRFSNLCSENLLIGSARTKVLSRVVWRRLIFHTLFRSDWKTDSRELTIPETAKGKLLQLALDVLSVKIAI